MVEQFLAHIQIATIRVTNAQITVAIVLGDVLLGMDYLRLPMHGSGSEMGNSTCVLERDRSRINNGRKESSCDG